MDDQRLGKLFRSAAASVEPPEAGFDHADVLAGSRRIARRQRITVAVAVAAMAGLGVGTVFAGGLLRSGPTSTVAQAPPADASPEVSPGTAADGAGGQAREAPAAGDAATAPQARPAPAPYAARDAAGQEAAQAPNAAPPGARSKSLAAPPGIVAGCYKPSAEVFAQLTEVLPEVRGHPARPVPGGCGEGGIGAAVDVPGGHLAVTLTPAGVSAPEPADDPTRRSVVVSARSGRVLRITITASSPDGPPPYRDRLRTLADNLADRL